MNLNFLVNFNLQLIKYRPFSDASDWLQAFKQRVLILKLLFFLFIPLPWEETLFTQVKVEYGGMILLSQMRHASSDGS